jgi:anti-sigma-K factor RskA
MKQDSQDHNQPNFAADSGNFNDLSWLAFRYIAGEMPADECRDFEIRLQDDQDAREAVADAVADTQSINMALEQAFVPTTASNFKPTAKSTNSKSTNSTRTRPRLTKPITLAVLACSLAAIVIFYGLNQNNQGNSIADATTTATAAENAQIDLAEAWADSDWELTLVAHSSANEMEADFNLDDASTEFDSDWIEAALDDLDAKSMSIEN